MHSEEVQITPITIPISTNRKTNTNRYFDQRGWKAQTYNNDTLKIFCWIFFFKETLYFKEFPRDWLRLDAINSWTSIYFYRYLSLRSANVESIRRVRNWNRTLITRGRKRRIIWREEGTSPRSEIPTSNTVPLVKLFPWYVRALWLRAFISLCLLGVGAATMQFQAILSPEESPIRKQYERRKGIP